MNPWRIAYEVARHGPAAVMLCMIPWVIVNVSDWHSFFTGIIVFLAVVYVGASYETAVLEKLKQQADKLDSIRRRFKADE